MQSSVFGSLVGGNKDQHTIIRINKRGEEITAHSFTFLPFPPFLPMNGALESIVVIAPMVCAFNRVLDQFGHIASAQKRKAKAEKDAKRTKLNSLQRKNKKSKQNRNRTELNRTEI